MFDSFLFALYREEKQQKRRKGQKLLPDDATLYVLDDTDMM